MFSFRGGCKFFAVHSAPVLPLSPRHRCIPRALFNSLATGAVGLLRPIAAAATRLPTAGSGSGHGETAVTGIGALSPVQKEQITAYIRTLLEWNQRMNLTAVTEESEVMTRHVEDSLAIIPPLRRHYVARCCREGGGVYSDCGHLKMVDVGTGPGLPGLIIAIACPDWKLTLLDSMQKRCLFLEHVIGLIGLTNVEVLHDRAECAGQNMIFREIFDVAVARAVAELRTLAEYCLPFVRVGGLFVAAKGFDPQEEIETAQHAVKLLGASVVDVCSVESQGPYGQRTAVICYKERATPKKYPRLNGLPAKMPL